MRWLLMVLALLFVIGPLFIFALALLSIYLIGGYGYLCTVALQRFRLRVSL